MENDLCNNIASKYLNCLANYFKNTKNVDCNEITKIYRECMLIFSDC